MRFEFGPFQVKLVKKNKIGSRAYIILRLSQDVEMNTWLPQPSCRSVANPDTATLTLYSTTPTTANPGGQL